ncbi:TetR/AcrR family transcriptional regulator C-terminal domain-containing protein [Vibrio sp. F74]|uniref:TetR/AcrR family transcriptional regulator C-terminal domain-containing protein n=1 Tax=Vibrio sp. F74 TaxID=700020 RepID=UPI0036F43E47
MSEESVAINRSAISELRTVPELAQTLTKVGRDATIPVFIRFLEHQHEIRELTFSSSTQAVEDFLGLLVGDLSVRRFLGVIGQLSDDDIGSFKYISNSCIGMGLLYKYP